jgi:predicted RND superfamily exporter protein
MGKPVRKYPDDRRLFVYKLVDYRIVPVGFIIVVSFLALPFAINLELDRTLKAAYVTSSPAYEVYKGFVDRYGSDEFVLIAIKSEKGASDSHLLKAIDTISKRLKERPELAHVVSLSTIKVFDEKDGIFGSYPLIEKKGGVSRLRAGVDLEKIRTALPIMDFVLSPDMKTLGILFRLKDQWRFHPDLGALLKQVEDVVRTSLPSGSEYRVVGAPVVREAVQRLTVRTTIIFSSLCALLVALITLYIFKSLRVAGITMLTVGIAVLWVLGLMSLCGITLNATTSISFGLILITSVATVIHIVSHFCQVWPQYHDQELAVKRAMAVVGRGCIMSAVTTSIAFATVMISSIPMVQQLGFIMAVGVMIAFFIGFVLTPSFLMRLRPLEPRVLDRMQNDWFSAVLRWTEDLVFRRYRLCTWAGIGFTVLMLAGAPLIRIDTQLLSLFVPSSTVMSDMRFVEQHLHPIRGLEISVELDKGAFKNPDAWKKMDDLRRRLLQIPGVASVDSFSPMIEYIYTLLDHPSTTIQDRYPNKAVLSEILSLVSFSSDGRELLSHYVTGKFGGAHMTVRFGSTGPTSLNQLIEKIDKTVSEVMGPSANTAVTGEQAVFAAQASEVVHSQVWSVILALTAITLLLIWQLRSLFLGLMSLVPIIPPIAVILGMMGWVGIPLDNVTVFATCIAIGLAVDDTFHYLTQVRREIAASMPGEGRVRGILQQSFHHTARSLMSTTAPLVIGFLALTLTPTKPAIFFGFLGAASMIVALFGNVIFLPAIMLTSKRLSGLMEKEALAKAVPSKAAEENYSRAH